MYHGCMAVERHHQFKILLSNDEKAWLQTLADAKGLTPTDYLRQYIRDEVGREASRTGSVTSGPKTGDWRR
jgi:hypothetical protein